MADIKDTDSVTCTNCGRSHTFMKGTLTAEALKKFVCSGCSSSTLESNVQKHQQAGKKLLTEG